MIEAFGNIWDNQGHYDAVVITTNGTIKKDGNAVLGRGIALQATHRYFHLATYLGERLKKTGNLVYVFNVENNWFESDIIITFPVKHHWREKADINLIKSSAMQLKGIVTALGLDNIIMPRPGCGNGGLIWEEVQPVINSILDDRFTVMEKL